MVADREDREAAIERDVPDGEVQSPNQARALLAQRHHEQQPVWMLSPPSHVQGDFFHQRNLG